MLVSNDWINGDDVVSVLEPDSNFPTDLAIALLLSFPTLSQNRCEIKLVYFGRGDIEPTPAGERVSDWAFKESDCRNLKSTVTEEANDRDQNDGSKERHQHGRKRDCVVDSSNA